jgi:hypothetical protein
MMPMQVWKYSKPLPEIDDVIEFQMPRGTKVLSVGNQHETLTFWCEVDSSQPPETSARRFRVAGTGHPLDEFGGFLRGRFLGTVQFMGGSLVFHVYAEHEPAPGAGS